MLPRAVANPHSIPDGEQPEIFGQLSCRRHRRPLHDNRDHPDAAPERSGDFRSHVVIGIVQPAAAAGVLRIQPVRTDYREQHVTSVQRLVQCLDEILAGSDVTDVHEHVISAETPIEFPRERAGKTGAVVAAIADEDPGHGARK
jgi:hypothetical protein